MLEPIGNCAVFRRHWGASGGKLEFECVYTCPTSTCVSYPRMLFPRTILVTGGAGFIGSCLVRQLVAAGQAVVTLDKLTYAGNRESLAAVGGEPRHTFVLGDIGDEQLVRSLLAEHRPAAILNLAAETHVDRSIDSPGPFIATNVLGVCRLLETVRGHYQLLDPSERAAFRFLHVSTDEVFGSLAERARSDESSPLAPNSPYAASKAAADGFVRAYHHTYGLPTIITNSSNNYGPFQYPEKLIPLMIGAAVAGRALPLYGDGRHVRQWLHVEDHASGLRAALERGRPGEVYNLGGREELTNRRLVEMLCEIIDELRPELAPTAARITHVADRPGHDRRYALDSTKAERELGWRPEQEFREGLRETVAWYLEHADWSQRVTAGVYHGERLGMASRAPSS
jgi:dTDP-glucose 4,6-dehydratase